MPAAMTLCTARMSRFGWLAACSLLASMAAACAGAEATRPATGPSPEASSTEGGSDKDEHRQAPTFPAALVCFGNEPFWRLDLGADGAARCSETCSGPEGLRISHYQQSQDGQLQTLDIVEPSGEPFLSATIKQTGACSDTMSDAKHMFEVQMHGKPGDFRGCCNPASK